MGKLYKRENSYPLRFAKEFRWNYRIRGQRKSLRICHDGPNSAIVLAVIKSFGVELTGVAGGAAASNYFPVP